MDVLKIGLFIEHKQTVEINAIYTEFIYRVNITYETIVKGGQWYPVDIGKQVQWTNKRRISKACPYIAIAIPNFENECLADQLCKDMVIVFYTLPSYKANTSN